MNNIAIIPARSGSKGLPGKNIKELFGKPLMAYSIEAALASECFSTVMVSTDSEKYAEVARRYGAEVPFLRSEQNSADKASSWDTVREVLAGYQKFGEEFDTFCLLQPTSPLRTADDIKQAYSLYKEKKAVTVISMTVMEHPIEWCGKLDESLGLEGFIERGGEGQRQKMGASYRPNGAIYIFSISEFYKDDFIYQKGSYAYIMPRERSVDIDTEFDFALAEFLKGYKNH